MCSSNNINYIGFKRIHQYRKTDYHLFSILKVNITGGLILNHAKLLQTLKLKHCTHHFERKVVSKGRCFKK